MSHEDAAFGNQIQFPRGISVDARGHVSVDKAMGELLFDLALELEGAIPHPVDVEHVLAAIVMATRGGEIRRETTLSKSDPQTMDVLRRNLEKVFRSFGDQLGSEDFDS